MTLHTREAEGTAIPFLHKGVLCLTGEDAKRQGVAQTYCTGEQMEALFCLPSVI